MKQRKFMVPGIILIIILLLSSVCSADVNSTLIALRSEPSSINNVGQIVRVSISAQNANNLYGIDLDMSYDPAALTAVDQSGNAVGAVTLGAAFSTPNKFVVRNQVDNATGKMKLAVSFLGIESGITGTSELGYIYFKVKKAEPTMVQIDNKMAITKNANTGQLSEVQVSISNANLVVASQSAPIPVPPIEVSPIVVPPAVNTIPAAPEPIKTPPVANANTPSFADIDNSWAKKEIMQAASLNIISGDGKGKYNPKNNVTREEFAKIIFSALGLKEEQKPSASFADEKKISSWAKNYVGTISSMGLMQGDNGSFNPQKGLSRYETAVILAKALKLKEDATGCDSFKDKDKIPAWARGYVGAAYKSGLIKGMPDGSFAGTATVSREQAASLIIRFMELR